MKEEIDQMNKVVIGNIYENPELLECSKNNQCITCKSPLTGDENETTNECKWCVTGVTSKQNEGELPF